MNQFAVLLRGPSASGKSTVAKALKAKTENDVALVEFDVFRNEILSLTEDYYPASTEMYVQTAKIAIEYGYSVVLDGIFRDDEQNTGYHRLLENLGIDIHSFYFDITLEQTKSRHSSRKKSGSFDASKLEDWWYSPQPLGVENEYRIEGTWSIEQTVEFILETLRQTQ